MMSKQGAARIQTALLNRWCMYFRDEDGRECPEAHAKTWWRGEIVNVYLDAEGCVRYTVRTERPVGRMTVDGWKQPPPVERPLLDLYSVVPASHVGQPLPEHPTLPFGLTSKYPAEESGK
jgi:hypothetical protein